jgi:hypothetical protein
MTTEATAGTGTTAPNGNAGSAMAPNASTAAPAAEGTKTETPANGQPKGDEKPAGGASLDLTSKPADAAKPNADTTQAIQYEPSGDAALDMALTFLGKNGIAPDHPAMIAAEGGDFAMLKAHFAALGVQGAAEMLAMGEQAYGRRNTAAQAAAQAQKDAIFSVVGGEEGWNQIKTWVGANATDGEKAEITAVMQKGGLTAKVMAQWLQGKVNGDPSLPQKPAETRAKGAAGKGTPAASTSGALDGQAYRAEVSKLVARLGHTNIDNHPDYKALQSRRMAFKG